MPILGQEAEQKRVPINEATEIMARTIIEFHSVEIAEADKPKYWGQKEWNVNKIKVVVWKNMEFKDDTHNHFGYCKERFEELCKYFSIN